MTQTRVISAAAELHGLMVYEIIPPSKLKLHQCLTSSAGQAYRRAPSTEAIIPQFSGDLLVVTLPNNAFFSLYCPRSSSVWAPLRSPFYSLTLASRQRNIAFHYQ